MKKKKLEPHIYNKSAADERQYQQKLKADQSMFQMLFSSFSQCCGFPLYPCGDPMFLQTDILVKKSEDNGNKDDLKGKNKCQRV